MKSRRAWIAFGLCAAAAPIVSAADANNSREVLTQGAWAAMIAGRLGLASPGTPQQPAEAAALLDSGSTSVDAAGASASLLLRDGRQGTWQYAVAVPRTASWLLTVRNPQPAFVSVNREKSILLSAGGFDGASDAGTLVLRAGTHAVTITTASASAPDLTLTAGCHPIRPAGGWQLSARLTYGNLARTLVQALHENGRLPAAEGLSAIAIGGGVAQMDAPAAGIYTVLVAGRAAERAGYRIDRCEETVLPAPAADGWREGSSVPLAAGAHRLVLAGPNTKLGDGRARLVRRASGDVEYLAVLQSLGAKLPEGEKASADPRDDVAPRTGLARRASGDPRAGLGALANRVVTREDAERILATPAIARALSRGGAFPRAAGPESAPDDDEIAGTLVEPVTQTLQPTQEADPW